ncbi:MAG: cation:proton antiporter [Nocardioidaceae bacterium]
MTELLVIAAAVYGFALVSRRLSMSPVTAPMVFTAVGLTVGDAGLEWFDLGLEGEAVSILIEATLVLVLFTDAIRIDLRKLRKESRFPARLLGVGLPLTLLLGTGAAWLLFPAFTLVEAALLAAVLTPTDAALGQAVVSDRRLPVRLRQGLNVESGLNDGLMVPIVTITLAVSASEAGGTGGWGEFVVRQIGFGLLLGVGMGAVGGRLLHLRAVAGRVEGIYRQLATIAIAAGAYASAELLGGNGFIAVFTAGLAFGHLAREQCSGVQDFTEDEGELLNAITFIVFGAVLAGPALEAVSWQILGYVTLSLTVVRMAPVVLALAGTRTLVETRLFAGWFGPRGLASILFALIVLEQLDSTQTDVIFDCAIWTVLVSVFAHGLTASPWATRLAKRLSAAPGTQPELAPAPEMPTRRRLPS